MEARFEIKDPDEIEATLTITATVKELRFLRKHTEAIYGTAEFRNMLGDIIAQAESKFYAETDT